MPLFIQYLEECTKSKEVELVRFAVGLLSKIRPLRRISAFLKGWSTKRIADKTRKAMGEFLEQTRHADDGSFVMIDIQVPA